MSDQSLFNTSRIPTMLTLAHVNEPRCIECGSRDTWLLESKDAFTPRKILFRLCDSCGRVTGAYTGEVVQPHVQDQRQDHSEASPSRPSSGGPYLRGGRELRALRGQRLDR